MHRDIDVMPLRLGPARLVREVVGNGEELARAAHPSDCRDIAERVTLGMRQPQRALDVVWLHPPHDARIERGELDLGERGQCPRLALVERTLGDEDDARAQLAVDDLAGPALVLIAFEPARG